MMTVTWSSEVPFTQSAINQRVAESPGVYEILQDAEYRRYEGTTRVLKIGKSDTDLRQELTNHFVRHTAANRLTRIRNRPGIRVAVLFAVLPADQVAQTESALLRRFEDEHWDLPVLNSQRGYGRADDGHYRKPAERVAGAAG